MDVSAVGSSTQSSAAELAQLLQEFNQMQIDVVKNMLQVQAEQMVGAAKMQDGEQAQGAVDYYA